MTDSIPHPQLTGEREKLINVAEQITDAYDVPCGYDQVYRMILKGTIRAQRDGKTVLVDKAYFPIIAEVLRRTPRRRKSWA